MQKETSPVLLAARRVGPTGRALGVDACDEMIARGRGAAAAAGLAAVEVRKGDLHEWPVNADSVDVVISNGCCACPESSAAGLRRPPCAVVRTVETGHPASLTPV